MTLTKILQALNDLSIDEKLTLYSRLRSDPRVRAFTETNGQYQTRRDNTVKKLASEADHIRRWRRRQQALG